MQRAQTWKKFLPCRCISMAFWRYIAPKSKGSPPQHLQAAQPRELKRVWSTGRTDTLGRRHSAHVLQATSVIGRESGLVMTVLTDIRFQATNRTWARVHRNFCYWHERTSCPTS